MEKELQWSITFGGQMYVVRKDDKDEKRFDELVEKYQKMALDYMNMELTIKAVGMKPQKTYTASTGGFIPQKEGEVCKDCGKGEIVLNPRTGKTFCNLKCWLNKAKTY